MFRRATAAALAIAILCVGCAAPNVTYEDPLAQIGRGVAAPASTQFKALTLGVVFTDNTRKAMGVANGEQQLIGSFGVFTNQSALADSDPKFLTQSIDAALKRRFKDVLVLASPAERAKAGADAVMFLDVQINIASYSGRQTTVALQGIFVDQAQQAIGEVKGNGAGTIPYPATTTGFKAAAAEAVQRFAAALDRSSDLANRLGEPAVLPVVQTLPPALAPPAIAADGKRVALVIGNGAYRNVPRLANTTTDARLIAASLRKVGFVLVGGGPLFDLDRAGFVKAVAEFGDRLQGSAVGVFYYAGHGLQMQGENYLVPVEANPTRPADADLQLIDTSLVLHQMEDSKASLKVVILDACRNNPFGGRGLRDATGGLAQMRAPEGTVISYATQPGNVASDGDAGRDSPYTIALARSMTTPGLDVLAMFNEVGVLVDGATMGVQQPWLASSPIKGRFYFAGQ